MTVLAPKGLAGDADDRLDLGLGPARRAGGPGRWRTPLIGLLLLGGGLAAAVTLLGPPAGSPAFLTKPVTRGDIHVVVTATGTVQPTGKVEVSSELSGTVRRVYVDYNSPVTAGQVLAELDTDKFKASADSSRAKLDAARARVAEAEVTVAETAREYTRKAALAAAQHGSRHDLDSAAAARDRAVASLASARADVAAAAAELTLNESNLAKTIIRSPVDGVVLSRAVEPGQTVAASLQAPVLFTLAEDLRHMEVRVDVDEADVGRVREGQAASFTVDAHPNRRFPAVIRELRYASETVQNVVTYKAVLTVDNGEMLLRPGMTATAEIAVQDVSGALLVPNAALRFTPPAEPAEERGGFLRRLIPGPPPFRPPSARPPSGPARTVWVLRDDAPAPVPVTVGASDGTATEMVGGTLPEGTAVIVDTVARR